MAEGMISNEDRGRGETLRDVAEHYLFELASKCMVEVKMDEKSTSNRFESCRLHDMIRELCLSKAKDEEFFKVVDKPMGVDDEPSTCKTSRLAIHLDEREDDHIWKDQDLRSLLSVNNRRGRVKRCWNNLDLGMFKFLRILILEKHRFKNKKLPNGIGKLILLKYLSIKDSEVDELPKSVCKLLCLQSLDLRVESDFTLPNSIHKLRHLKHLFVNNVLRSVIGGKKLKLDGLNELETLIGFRSDIDETTHLLKLRKLQVLDAVVTDDQSLPMIVDHIFNHQDQFREVHLMILSNINSEQDSSLLRKVFMCRSLSELSIGHVSKLPAYELELGRNLIRLNLHSQCNIAKDPMAILEKLPMLRELIFREDSYVGREMVCRAAGFPQLKKLMLWELPNLEEWRVEEGAMPNLSFLDIHKCEKLEMIPDGLKSITTLQELSITWMSKKFVDRIKVVNGEEGEDYHKIKHIPSLHIW
ncbi:putative disease resistance protein RXW24L [Sesamum alatum]|uniref:Disease resistance protein RXW24L n=1 Tax=Sesamum alatum TaxID=300844 RepID=A0AAE1Y7L0_9LAMI|nr:putative disease resistance protein RXW24L [Sesamum alatum]